MNENDGHQRWSDFSDKVPGYTPSNPKEPEAFEGESDFFKDLSFEVPPPPPSPSWVYIGFLYVLATALRLGVMTLIIMGVSSALADQWDVVSPALGWQTSLYLSAMSLFTVWVLKRA